MEWDGREEEEGYDGSGEEELDYRCVVVAVVMLILLL